MGIFLGKKNCSSKIDQSKKHFVQQTVKSKKFVHKTGRKMRLYVGDLLIPLPERKKGFVSS